MRNVSQSSTWNAFPVLLSVMVMKAVTNDDDRIKEDELVPVEVESALNSDISLESTSSRCKVCRKGNLM